MKKIFSLLAAVACCSMVFGQIISVTDGTLSDWDNVPSEYLFKTECAPNASMNGLKSVQVYVDMTYINLLVEINDEVVTDRDWTPFHVFINSDNNAATGGYGDQWTTADTDLMLETAIFSAWENYPYNPAVYKWWGPNGENGWQWIDPNDPNGWEGIVPAGSLPIGNSQMVDGKVEIQLDYTLIPYPFDSTTFTLGFDIQQFWSSVGILPNADNYELAEKLRVNVHQKNNTNATIDGILYKLTSNVEPYTAGVFSLLNKDENITEIIIPETIVVNGITYTITSIESSAFKNCTSITSITIPEGVTTIGSNAFENCSSLSSVVWNAKNYMGKEKPFSSIADQITSFVIGNNVEDIPYGLCSGMSSLQSITIPNSVKSIGSSAFSGCTSLTSISIPESVELIGVGVFARCFLRSLAVEEGNSIYDSRENCHAIIETATNTLIAGCGNTTIPEGVISIGSQAFDGCYFLNSVTIPNSVTSIGGSAFSGCTSLSSITIPNSVTSIGEFAFSSCSSLTSIAIPGGVTSIEHGVFASCSSLTSVTLPNSVTSIGGSAFSGCTSLTSVTLPNSVTSIGSSAFSGCTSLTSISIPESVEQIGYWAFANCSSLTSITIPESVTTIGFCAFENCIFLTTVICEAVEVPELEEDVFRYMSLSDATLFVPAQSMDDYKAADQWKEFGTILPLEAAPSSVENIPSTMTNCQKIIRNGQLLIFRDGKTYNVMGQEL